MCHIGKRRDSQGSEVDFTDLEQSCRLAGCTGVGLHPCHPSPVRVYANTMQVFRPNIPREWIVVFLPWSILEVEQRPSI